MFQMFLVVAVSTRPHVNGVIRKLRFRMFYGSLSHLPLEQKAGTPSDLSVGSREVAFLPTMAFFLLKVRLSIQSVPPGRVEPRA
jgi:hypothetical protein